MAAPLKHTFEINVTRNPYDKREGLRQNLVRDFHRVVASDLTLRNGHYRIILESVGGSRYETIFHLTRRGLPRIKHEALALYLDMSLMSAGVRIRAQRYIVTVERVNPKEAAKAQEE